MMDSKTIRETALAYLSVYDQDLREEMEELGVISEDDTYYEAREPGVRPYRPNPTQAEVRADAAAARAKQVKSSEGQKGYGDKVGSSPELTKRPDKETAEWLRRTKSPYGKRIVGQMGREYGSRTAAGVTRVVKGAGEPQAVTLPRSTRVSREIVRKPKTQSEEFDIYDVVLSHLLDEGYAETLESAEAIMVNMSEEWIDTIIEEFEDIVESEYDYKDLPRRRMINKSRELRASKDPKKKARAADIEYRLRAHSPEASKTLSYINTEYGRG